MTYCIQLVSLVPSMYAHELPVCLLHFFQCLQILNFPPPLIPGVQGLLGKVHNIILHINCVRAVIQCLIVNGINVSSVPR